VDRPRVAEALTRPFTGGQDALGAWDDYPVHQSSAVLGVVQPSRPNWSERFYFNVIAPSGEVLAILGGGVYPLRGVSECYFCRMDGDRQVNIRSFGRLPAPGEPVQAGPFALRCEEPLRRWIVDVNVEGSRFRGQFSGISAPYLYEAVDVPPSEPGGEYDLYRHFVAVGEWNLEHPAGIDTSRRLLGVRDRTWGVRTRRIRWHNWCVFQIGERTVTLIHQELADGTVMHSEAGVIHGDGDVERLRIADHDVTYEPDTRQVTRARWTLAGEHGDLGLEYERVGHGMRLAGAGYDDSQGERLPGDVQRDAFDLSDPEVARRTGRGTMDQGARVHATGAWEGDGIGVVESAIARNHVRYGHQVA
jgi:hypothetical protein